MEKKIHFPWIKIHVQGETDILGNNFHSNPIQSNQVIRTHPVIKVHNIIILTQLHKYLIIWIKLNFTNTLI